MSELDMFFNALTAKIKIKTGDSSKITPEQIPDKIRSIGDQQVAGLK